MINGVNPLEHAPSQTITFWGNFRFCRPPHDLQPIFDHFEHCTCHQDQKSSEKRILKVSSFRKLCRTQFANFIFFLLFSKPVRIGSTLFLYERYPRFCFKILTTDPLEISSSPAIFRIDTFVFYVSFVFSPFGSFLWS